MGLQGGFGHFAPGRALSSMWSQTEVRPWANFNRISSPAWYQWPYLTPTDRYSNNGTAEYGRMANGSSTTRPRWPAFTLHLSASPERTEVPLTLRREGRGYSASLNYDSDSLSACWPSSATAAVTRHFRWLAIPLWRSRRDGRLGLRAWPYGTLAKAVTLGATYQWDRPREAGGLTPAHAGADQSFLLPGRRLRAVQRTTLYARLGRKSYEYGAAGLGKLFGVGHAHAF